MLKSRISPLDPTGKTLFCTVLSVKNFLENMYKRRISRKRNDKCLSNYVEKSLETEPVFEENKKM